jgi:hypothetical protein
VTGIARRVALAVLGDDRLIPWAFFVALALIYGSLSPLSVIGMGYAGENFQSTANLISWARGHDSVMNWPRHGFLDPLLGVPFMLAGRLLSGGNPLWEDAAYSLQPIVFTALLCTVVLVWVGAVTGSRTWGLVLAATAAFATMLWPYAYIGLETTQSLFLLVAGHLALRPQGSRRWPATLGFGVAAAFAVSAKANGLLLVPAVAFLVHCFFRDSDSSGGRGRAGAEWMKPAAVGVLIVGVSWLAMQTRAQFWTRTMGAAARTFANGVVIEDEPVMVVFHAWSLFFSINKGLLVFAPVLVLSLAASVKALRADARVVIFAALVLLPTVGALSLLASWSDEVWGPRYLHCAVAPLIVAYAASRKGRPFRASREAAWLSLAAAGTVVSFLGAFFHYGQVYGAATRSSLSTLEAYQYDPNLNHIRFNLRLLGMWARPPQAAENWPPPRFWLWARPADRERVHRVDLRPFAVPQSVLARAWGASRPVFRGSLQALRRVLAACLGLGLGLLAWTAWLVRSTDAPGRIAACPPEVRAATG